MSLFFTGATPDECWPLVRDFHYSRRMPAAAQHCFVCRGPGGLFGDFGEPQAAVIYGNPVNKYMPPDALELLRLVRRHDFSKPLSQLLAWSLRWLRQHTLAPFVLTYADSAEKHHGGIYQATGFVYCGEKGVPFDKVAGFKDASGNFVHARSCNARYGTHQRDKILDRFPEWQVVEALPKHFYVKPLRQRLKPLLKRFNWDQLRFPKPHYAGRLVDASGPPELSLEHTQGPAPVSTEAG